MKKILIVEDELEASGAMKSLLESQGFEVCAASDGEEGLRMARALMPDLLLLDLMLPKMSGFIVTRLLKFDEKYKKIPIIILSARVEEQEAALSSKVGADAYFTKPIKPDLVLRKIKELLSAEPKKE